MEKTNEYTIFVFTENHIGLLNRITIIFTRRHINIESLTVSASEIPGIHRFTIVVNVTEDMAKKVVKQIEKLVDVLRARFYQSMELIHGEIAMFKMNVANFSGGHVEKIVRKYNARILTIEDDYVVIEKTGPLEETHELFVELQPFGILQFCRSGRIAITRSQKELSVLIEELEQAKKFSELQMS